MQIQIGMAVLLAFAMAGVTNVRAGERPISESKIKSLIDSLTDVTEAGYGYSASVSGSQFLPDHSLPDTGPEKFGGAAPIRSTALEEIVRCGHKSVPILLNHLQDRRLSRIPPLQANMWMAVNDEYDFNRLTRTNSPAGVNRDSEAHRGYIGQSVLGPNQHAVTVGDLCFVALGQIVNRSFSAARYEPVGGMVVSSPPNSDELCNAIRADYSSFDADRHAKQLIEDFERPDSDERRIGACRRLAYYYPHLIESLIVKQLKVPTLDLFRIERFVRFQLYPESSLEKRRLKLDQFLAANPAASRDGVILQLFSDLAKQEADEEFRLYPPLEEKFQARKQLVQVFGFDQNIRSGDNPVRSAWSLSDRDRFIRTLATEPNPRLRELIRPFLKHE